MKGVSVTRLITPHDAPALARLVRANREFLAPREPVRGEDYFTEDGQRADILGSLAQYAQGVKVPHVIVRESGGIAGRITLNTVVRGAFQSASVGYWLGAADNGRGLATAAVRDMIKLAFQDLGLHRLEAGPGWTTSGRSGSWSVAASPLGAGPGVPRDRRRWQDSRLDQLLDSGPG